MQCVRNRTGGLIAEQIFGLCNFGSKTADTKHSRFQDIDMVTIMSIVGMIHVPYTYGTVFRGL